MHCHLDVHLPWGLGMAFEVENGPTPDSTLPPPPPDFPQCQNKKDLIKHKEYGNEGDMRLYFINFCIKRLIFFPFLFYFILLVQIYIWFAFIMNLQIHRRRHDLNPRYRYQNFFDDFIGPVHPFVHISTRFLTSSPFIVRIKILSPYRSES